MVGTPPLPAWVAGSYFEFAASPPRDSDSPLEGRKDVRNVQVKIRRVEDVAQVAIDGRVVASTSRGELREWLQMEGPRRSYVEGRLTLRYTNSAIWFQVRGRTESTILTKPAVDRIIVVLGD